MNYWESVACLVYFWFWFNAMHAGRLADEAFLESRT
jgi:hypothetical protein